MKLLEVTQNSTIYSRDDLAFMGNVFQTEVDMAKAIIVAVLVLCNIAMKQNMPMSEGAPGDGYSGANVGQPGDPEDRVLEGPINLQRNGVRNAEWKVVRN